VTSTGLTVNDNTNGLIIFGPSSTRRIGAGADYAGFRFYSDNSHGFYTNNVERLKIGSTGNVNIPNGSLMIGATTAPTEAITILDSTNSTAGQRIKIGYQSSDFNYTVGRNTTTGHLDFIGTNSAGSGFIGYNFNGAITSTGLTVANNSFARITLQDLDATNQKGFLDSSGGDLNLTSQNGTSHGNIFLKRYNGTNTILSAQFSSNGDISFYEDTGTTPKLFWDASAESLGIGTTSPDSLLHLKSTGDTRMTIESPDANDSYINFSGATNEMSLGFDTSDAAMYITNHGTITANRRVTIKTNGNVGLGTTSPSNLLDCTGSISNDYIAAFENTNATNGYGLLAKTAHTGTSAFAFGAYGGSNALMVVRGDGRVGIGGITSPDSQVHIKTSVDNSVSQGLVIERSANTDKGYINYQGGAFRMVATDGDPIRFGHVSTSNEISIHTNGNLLIGKTADNDSDVGIRMQSTGHTSIVKSGGNCLTLNRLGDDGSLLDFRKDTGTLVGSIESATNTTTDLAIGSGNVRLLFFTNGSAIVPRAENNNSANGTIDLGNSGNKFKDAHFSGTVTSATGSFTGTSTASVFTRTGSAGQVLQFKFGASSTGNITVQTAGLGFGGGTRENDLFINTSGTVLIGKTADNDTSAGIRFQSNGSGSFVRDNNVALQVNRLTGDGSLIEFRKDSSLVGSIGVVGGDDLFIAGGSTGLRFDSGVGKIYPTNGSGTVSDNTVDIGEVNYRFKDAHFAGTINTRAVTVENDISGDATLRLKSTSGGDPTLIFNSSAANRSGLIKYQDNGTNVGRIEYVHNGDRIDIRAGSATGATMSIKNSGVMIGSTTQYRNLLVSFNNTETNTSSASSGFGNTSNVGTGLMINNINTNNNTYAPLDFKCGTNNVYGRIAYKATDMDDAFGQFEFITMHDNSAVNALTIASNGNVGIGGLTSPAVPLDINSNSSAEGIRVRGRSSDNVGEITLTDSGGTARNQIQGSATYLNIKTFPSSPIVFFTGAEERMRVTSNGDSLFGTTNNLPALNNVAGVAISTGTFGGRFEVSRDNAEPVSINRMSSDGALISLKKDATTVGVIGSRAGVQLYIGQGNSALSFVDSTNQLLPHDISSNAPTDNVLDLGGSSNRFNDIYSARAIIPKMGFDDVGIRFDNSFEAVIPYRPDTDADSDDRMDLGRYNARWDDVFATNSTISTSDENEKQDISDLDETEKKVAVKAKALLKKYRWKSAVKTKGDDARIHFGIIAQDLKQAFESEGLDAHRYGMFCSNTWTDEHGTEQTKMGVRYNELLAFIISTL
jgi:hypothetical protein